MPTFFKVDTARPYDLFSVKKPEYLHILYWKEFNKENGVDGQALKMKCGYTCYGFFSEESYSPSMVNGKKRVGSNSLCQGPITSSIDYQMAKPGPAGRRTNHRRSNQPLQIGKFSAMYFPP